jgi:hypothetical protein
MYIDESGSQGLMSKKFFYGEKIGSILIQMGSEGMTE